MLKENLCHRGFVPLVALMLWRIRWRKDRAAYTVSDLSFDRIEVLTQIKDSVTATPTSLLTAPRICKKIALAATPNVVSATSQKLTKMATAVPKLVAAMVNDPAWLVRTMTTVLIGVIEDNS